MSSVGAINLLPTHILLGALITITVIKPLETHQYPQACQGQSGAKLYKPNSSNLYFLLTHFFPSMANFLTPFDDHVHVWCYYLTGCVATSRRKSRRQTKKEREAIAVKQSQSSGSVPINPSLTFHSVVCVQPCETTSAHACAWHKRCYSFSSDPYNSINKFTTNKCTNVSH